MLFLVLGLVGGLALFVFGERTFLARGPLVEDTGVVVEQGFSMENIAEGLQGRGVISNRYVFIAAAYVLGTTGKMQAGEYMIPAGASMKEVMQRIVAGDVVQHAITLAEGLTSAQIVQRLNENEILVGRINEIPAEGSLLPETYRITRGMSRQRLIDTMQLEQAQLLARVWAGRDPNLPLQSPEELVTLASIVEKETGVDAERARIAGVFINRLKRRMRLQSDPTILYGLYGGDAWSQPRTLYRSDMERENPYNTYQITGLPPGPIANPGREALEAVAHPAETAELYFVADGTGGHVFSQTYEQHQANVARWREVERQRRGPTTE
ncbi:endolytic transglycosylase MltG [Acuticoccus sp. 2012]|uniref:Endolytic murein transglycosylase n=2 Tax=Acuticoccus mangrovi TaxID=2796142 RepID=A0A934MH78_9HYPH|nr:endolytic transglycosylase MltG [Acuticoccus mangrovi]MBJ3776665.1 endolytic transglycosylase MltG [Acuticoccus mangrovi]